MPGHGQTVQVGSPEFRLAVLQMLPVSTQYGFLVNPNMHKEEPGWLASLEDVGLFSGSIFGYLQGDAGHESASRSMPFPAWQVPGSHPAYAGLAWLMCHPQKDAAASQVQVDPATGDPLERYQFEFGQSAWPQEVRAVLGRVVDDFLLSIKSSGFLAQLSRHHAQAVVRNANAALLLAACCAVGDTPRALGIAQACPEALHIPLPIELAHIQENASSRRGYFPSPVFFAAHHHRNETLQALVQAQLWDPLEPVAWKDLLALDNRRAIDTSKKSCTSYSAFELLHDDFLVRDWMPSTWEHFLRAYCDAPRRLRADYPGNDALNNVIGACINETDHEDLLPALERSGILAFLAHHHLQPAVKAGNERAFLAMRGQLRWDDFVADEFLPLYAMGSSWQAKRDRLNWACQLLDWCVEDGRLELVTQPHQQEFTTDGKYYVGHEFAAAGWAKPLIRMFEHGLDPQLKNATGKTALDLAIEQGHEHVAGAIRSFTARQQMQALLESPEFHGVSP